MPSPTWVATGTAASPPPPLLLLFPFCSQSQDDRVGALCKAQAGFQFHFPSVIQSHATEPRAGDGGQGRDTQTGRRESPRGQARSTEPTHLAIVPMAQYASLYLLYRSCAA